MKALKVLVILMGVAIVGGFAVIAFTLAGRMSGERVAADEPWRAALALPDGCRLGEAQLSENRILIRLEGAESLGCGGFLLVDARSGELLGRIEPGVGQ